MKLNVPVWFARRREKERRTPPFWRIGRVKRVFPKSYFGERQLQKVVPKVEPDVVKPLHKVFPKRPVL